MKTEYFRNRLSVMTVEDSRVVVERVQSMLSEIEGIDFLGNTSTISATWKQIENQVPDVLILDIHLAEDSSKRSGINLLIELRQRHPELVIMMFTNLTEPQYRSTCMLLGANYFFDKSNDFDKIPDTLNQLVLDKQKGTLK